MVFLAGKTFALLKGPRKEIEKKLSLLAGKKFALLKVLEKNWKKN